MNSTMVMSVTLMTNNIDGVGDGDEKSDGDCNKI